MNTNYINRFQKDDIIRGALTLAIIAMVMIHIILIIRFFKIHDTPGIVALFIFLPVWLFYLRRAVSYWIDRTMLKKDKNDERIVETTVK